MDPIRRLIFLALLASVVMAEPTQARALSAAVIAEDARPALVPGDSWIRRLSVLLRKTVRPIARSGPQRRRRLIDVARALVTPLAASHSHATFAAHAFRLPPPLVLAA